MREQHACVAVYVHGCCLVTSLVCPTCSWVQQVGHRAGKISGGTVMSDTAVLVSDYPCPNARETAALPPWVSSLC